MDLTKVKISLNVLRVLAHNSRQALNLQFEGLCTEGFFNSFIDFFVGSSAGASLTKRNSGVKEQKKQTKVCNKFHHLSLTNLG
jgi:hypothetical protein